MSDLTYSQRAHRYAQMVADGTYPKPVCKWIKMAGQRHLRDLKRRDWRWRYLDEYGDRYCQFMELMPHVKGQWDDPKIKLEDWQTFFICSTFGWVDKDTFYRRFRKALLVVARGNTKTTLAAGLANGVLCLDQEPGAQLYSGAKTGKQARICWGDAKEMVRKTPQMQDMFQVRAWAHSITESIYGGSFQTVTRDAKVSEGYSVHLGIIDELHAHPDRQVYDTILMGMRARRQPLLIEISTEGDDQSGVLEEEVEFLKDILEGKIDGERFFGLYYTLDSGDRWDDKRVWAKANPNLGVSVFEEEMEALVDQARVSTDAQATFITKRCNVRVGAVDGYYNMLSWAECEDKTLDEKDWIGCDCFFGVDLASEQDLAAFVRLYRRLNAAIKGNWEFALFADFYLPSEVLKIPGPNVERYTGWASGRTRYLTLTDGSSTDFGLLEREILKRAEISTPQVIGFDPSQATNLMQNIEAKGWTCLKIPQSNAHLSEPMKRLGSDMIDGRLKHGGNPVLTWNIGNVVPRWDKDKTKVFPTRSNPNKKIDGAVAAMLAKNREIVSSGALVNPYGSKGTAIV